MGTPEPRWDALVRQTAASNRRRRRRRRQRIMLWLLSVVTVVALLVLLWQVASQIRSLASESHRDEVRAFFFFLAMCRWARAKTSTRGRLLEVGQFAKDLKARIDFFAR